MIHFLQLAVLANVGVYVACRWLRYDLPLERRVIAATAFALVYSLPLPLGMLIHLLAPALLWILLKDPDADPRNRWAVFLVSYLFTALATLAFYHMVN